MRSKALLASIILLLFTNSPLAKTNQDYSISLTKPNVSTVELEALQQGQIIIKLDNKENQQDSKLLEDVIVKADCDLNCAELISVKEKSVQAMEGYAIFTITAKDKAGIGIILFDADGARALPVTITVTKPSYTLNVKDTDLSKGRELNILGENIIEVEVKKGTTPIHDGAEAEAIIMKGQGLFEEPPIQKTTTKSGKAIFRLTPKNEDGTAVIRFQIGDSFTDLKVYMSHPSFYKSIIQKAVSQIFDYAVMLAAIGVVAMALLQLIKWNDFIKGKVQSLFFRRYLPRESRDAIIEDVIRAAYGRYNELTAKLFFRQEPEEIIAQTKLACEQRINDLEAGDALEDFIDKACPMNESAQDKTKEIERRIANIKAYFDAIQIDMAAKWALCNQVTAALISVLIIGISLAFLYQDQSQIKIFALSFFGGLLAPLAKDFSNSIADITSKLKSI